MEIFPVDFVIHILNIIVLFIVVRGLAYKPVRKFMLEREARVKAQLDDAAKAQADAEALKNEYDKLVEGAENDRQILINDGHDTAIAEAHDIIDEARDQAEHILIRAKTDAELQVSRAMNDAKADVALAAVEIAGRVLRFNAETREKVMNRNTKLEGTSKGELKVADECSEADLEKIRSGLQNITGHNLELSVAVDSSLLGGFVAYIDGQVYDFSYLAQLHDMRQSLS